MSGWLRVGTDWVAILGECTVRKPSDKFTTLMARRKELLEKLQGQAVVIPVVFTSMEVSAADKAQAARDGLALAGAVELSHLYECAKQDSSPRETVQYLRELTREQEVVRVELPYLG